jgi:hypothetical protein
MALTQQNWSSSTPCDNTIFINTSYKLQQNELFHEEWLVTWTLLTTKLRIAKDAIAPNIAAASFVGAESLHETLNPIDSWSSKPTYHEKSKSFSIDGYTQCTTATGFENWAMHDWQLRSRAVSLIPILREFWDIPNSQ